jgi:phenylalanyl-tRNA synthetase alpha chain
LQLVEAGVVSSLDLAATYGVSHQEVVGYCKSMSTIEGLVVLKELRSASFQLTAEGGGVADNGAHEVRVFNEIPRDGVSIADFQALPGIVAMGPLAKAGQGKCMKEKWISIDKKAGVMKRLVESVVDNLSAQMQWVRDHPEAMDEKVLAAGGAEGAQIDDKEVKALVKRGLLGKVKVVSYEITQGPNFTLDPVIPESDMTSDMLKKDKWKSTKFKKFNLEAQPKHPAGALHPLLKVRSEFREIFLQMGFSEMPTNNYVESSFWNFDALFQPQQHPARDSHDTFFMKSPSTTLTVPEDYLIKVKAIHEVGGYGSIGYRYDWSKDEAKKNILRTHTTAVSTRMLYQLGQEVQAGKAFEPKKYFSIDRVFRNETLDHTHLAEFHQVEGLVCDVNLTLGHLIGMINSFFTKLGMSDIKFKPAYNPYTEPSMEIFGYSKELGKEVELGNSGIFRPEMLRPMGLPEDVTVIAWGLSVERPTMIKYGYGNIRDLFGASVDLNLVKTNPVCRL